MSEPEHPSSAFKPPPLGERSSVTLDRPAPDPQAVESAPPPATRSPIGGLLSRWPVLLAGALALVALVEIGAALIAPLRTPRPEHWRSAAAAVRAGFRAGDLIAIVPGWSDPAARQYLGDLMPPAMVGRPDAARYERVWEVSLRGARSPEAAERAIATSQHGPITVRLAEVAGEHGMKTVYDFTAELSAARASTLPPRSNDESPCLQDGDAFRCRGTKVERRMLEIDYAPRLGVLIPVEKGRVTRLEWQGAPLGSRLVVWAGLHDYYARKSADGAVELAVFVDGKPVSARILRGEDGWKGFEVDTTPQRGGRHSVRFEVESATPEWRNLGLHAEARLGASEELPE